MSDAPAAAWLRNNARIGGAGLAIFCAALVAWADHRIMELAEAGDSVIAINTGYAFLVSMFFVGLALLIGGNPVAIRLQSFRREDKSAANYLMIAAILIPGLLAYLWLEHRLSGLGYN